MHMAKRMLRKLTRYVLYFHFFYPSHLCFFLYEKGYIVVLFAEYSCNQRQFMHSSLQF